MVTCQLSIVMKRIYLDYAATTPIDKEVVRAIQPFISGKFGNPSSIHSFGQEAQGALDDARAKVAGAIQADFREIIFTSSATEANNLALHGFFKELKRRGAGPSTGGARPRLITTEIEHESVLGACRALEGERVDPVRGRPADPLRLVEDEARGSATSTLGRSASNGVEVIYLPVDADGRIKISALEKALNKNTVLVSVMYANNEIGTVQPISEIAQAIHKFKAEQKSFFPLFHTDAVQAFQFLDCDVQKLGVDFMTISGHKIYGPKGAGALYARNFTKKEHNGIFLSPLILGGGQEFALRSGTQNAAAIFGFAKAAELAVRHRAKEARRIAALRQKLWSGIKKLVPNAEINGSASIGQEKSLPNILNVYFPGENAQDLLIKLDLSGVAVSAGSACSARFSKPSHVVRALGCDSERTQSNLRFSLGRPTTEKEISKTLKVLKAIFLTPTP